MIDAVSSTRSALGSAQASIDEVRGHDRPLTMCHVIYLGIGRIAPMTGDFSAAEDAVATLIELATRANARFWMTAGQLDGPAAWITPEALRKIWAAPWNT